MSAVGLSGVSPALKGRSLWDDARRRLMRNRAAVGGMIVLALLTGAAIFGPWLTTYGYDQVNKTDVWLAPLTHGHLIGTDALGRDLLARLLMGLRVSLAIGLVATFVSLVIGVAWGATAGFEDRRAGQQGQDDHAADRGPVAHQPAPRVVPQAAALQCGRNAGQAHGAHPSRTRGSSTA